MALARYAGHDLKSLCCTLGTYSPSYRQAWNTGAILFMFWSGLGCLNFFINSVVWNGNAINSAPVWCDICKPYNTLSSPSLRLISALASRIIVVCVYGIPAASLCIVRRLYIIASCETMIGQQEKRRGIYADLAIGLGQPLLAVILNYIPQGNRFDIYEDFGCYPAIYSTWVSLVLVNGWPIAIGFVSMAYDVLIIRIFIKKRSEFQSMLSASSHSNLNASRYTRLIALAAVELCVVVPFGLYELALTAAGGISPWISFADTHSDFSYVGQIPAVVWKSDRMFQVSMELSRWSIAICPFIFFAFFGISEEARIHYKLAFAWVTKKTSYYTTAASSAGFDASVRPNIPFTQSGTGNTLPVFIRQKPVVKRESFDSFSTADLAGSRISSRPSLEEKPLPLGPPLPAHHP